MVTRAFVVALCLLAACSDANGAVPLRCRNDADIHIATTGSDAHGTGTACKPFASLSRAVSYVQTSGVNVGMRRDLNIILESGTWTEQAITIPAAASATNGHKIRVRSALGPGGSTRLLGGRLLSGAWTAVGGGVYKHAVSGDFYTLYVDGLRATEARTPNKIYTVNHPIAQAPYFTTVGVGDSLTSLQYNPVDFDPSAWTLSDVRFYVWSGGGACGGGIHPCAWFTDTVGPSSVNTVTKRFALAHETRHQLYAAGAGARYYAQGDYSFLDAANEWQHSPGASWVYSFGDLTGHEVCQPTTKDVITFDGASGWTLEGLSIECSDFTGWYRRSDPEVIGVPPKCAHCSSSPSRLDQLYDLEVELPAHRHGGVLVKGGANHIELLDTEVKATGYSGIFIDEDSTDITIQRLRAWRLGYNGVQVQGRYPSEGDTTKRIVIDDYKIRDVGELVGHGACVFANQAGNISVDHGACFDGPRDAVLLQADVFVSSPATNIYSRNNEIRRSWFSDLGQDSGDMGAMGHAFYSVTALPSPVVNTMDNLLITGIFAHPSMPNYAPYCVYFDFQTKGQVGSNIWCGTNQGGDLNDLSGGHTWTNVSFTGTFDETQLDCANIGPTSNYPEVFRSDAYGLSESFETGSIGWTDDGGTSTTTTLQSTDGSRSWVQDENDELLYQILPGRHACTVEADFYDTMDTTFESMLAANETGGTSGAWTTFTGVFWRAVGVYTSFSTTNYVVRRSSNITVTSKVRSLGWHHFKINYDRTTNGGVCGSVVSIDGTTVATYRNGVYDFNYVLIGDLRSAGGLSGTAYWDNVRVTCPW